MINPHYGLAVGIRVRIEREEALYPSKGTWPQFRGKTGTVVEINEDRRRPHLTEYAVTFGKVRRPRANGSVATAEAFWFKRHEIRALAPQRAVAASSTHTRMNHTEEQAA